MAAVDAQLFWLSAAVPNDQFLLYGFHGAPDIAAGLIELRRNAERCAALRVRVADDSRRRYPNWVDAEVLSDQFVVHPGGDLQQCLDALPRLDRLDATRMAWRVHVFDSGVVVVQISHALGDGRRSAALAAALLGRRPTVARPGEVRPGFLPWRAAVAARAHRDLRLLGPPAPPRPALSVNARPLGPPALRTLLVGRDRLRPTVTVGALVAIADALGGYLCARGEDVAALGAEIPMAGPATAANNNFGTVSVGLHPDVEPATRAARIAADLARQRRRAAHPATLASAAAFAAVPAWLLRWGVGRFDPAAPVAAVSGNTVVSSVDRGPADLHFGGCQVAFTAGFPALSPVQSLTHGVHGIGDTVAVSVHADSVNVDVDDYLERLTNALGCGE